MERDLSDASAADGLRVSGQEILVDNLSSLWKAVLLILQMLLDDLVDDWLNSDVNSCANQGFSFKDGTKDDWGMDHGWEASPFRNKYRPTEWE